MGTIVRHANSPFASGEVSDSSDLEDDIATAYREFNGLIENVNVLSTADINGSKLLNFSLTKSKLSTSDGLANKQLAKMAYFTSDATADVVTSSSTLVDVPSIPFIRVSPYTKNDVLIIRFTATYEEFNILGNKSVAWAFEVDGVDTNLLHYTEVGVSSSIENISLSYQWVRTADTTVPFLIKPRYLHVSGTTGGTSTFTAGIQANKIFTVIVLPG